MQLYIPDILFLQNELNGMKLSIFSYFMFFFYVHNVVHANNCEAKYYFDNFFSLSTNEIPEQKCVEIDITESYDSLSPEMKYHWNLGDGNIKEGLKITHCYKDFGRYEARLDVSLPDQEYTSNNEMNLDIIIKEEVGLFFQASQKGLLNNSISLSVNTTPLYTYSIQNIFWDYGDGYYACGEKNTKYQYQLPGKYTVRVLIIIKNADGQFYLGQERKILIEGFNLSGKNIYRIFKNSKDTLNAGAEFLNDPVQVAISDKNGHLIKQMKIDEAKEYCLLVPPDNEYNLHIWKANKIIPAVQFDTNTCSDSTHTFNIVNEAIEKSMKRDLLYLESIYFDYNQLEIDRKSKKILKKNIKIIKNVQPSVIQIGTYTHTKGTKEINFKYSVSRSEVIKDIIAKGIDNIDIRIEHPDKNDALINTCFDYQDCDKEDERLNRRCDIKILSF